MGDLSQLVHDFGLAGAVSHGAENRQGCGELPFGQGKAIGVAVGQSKLVRGLGEARPVACSNESRSRSQLLQARGSVLSQLSQSLPLLQLGLAENPPLPRRSGSRRAAA